MNKTWPLRLAAILVSTWIVAIVTAQSTAPKSDRIRRVENGLLTAVAIRDQPAVPMRITQRMAYYGVPGVSIAVINNGQLAWAKAYGVLAASGSEPVTTETRFQAASISKPVTAMAALALVEQNELRLDEDVNLKLTSWRVPNNAFTADQKVTLRRLLNHSAGLSRDEVGSYTTDEALPNLVQALAGEPPAKLPPISVEAIPGSQWRYSGGGYSVIQQLMMDATGKPFPELLREVVFNKLGMSASAFSQPLQLDWVNIAATGHDATGKPIYGRWHIFPEMAAAGLWTTPSDLARFAIEVQQSFKGEASRVLSAPTTRLMLTKHLGDYGLGFWLGGTQYVTGFSHGGFNEGFTCILTASLETGQGAAVMTNGDRGSDLFNEILRAIAHEYNWSDYQPIEKTIGAVNPAEYRAYVGDYEASGLPTATVTTDAGSLYVLTSALGSERVPLYPSAKDRFFMLERNIDVTFMKDNAGHVNGMEVEADGQRITARKVE